MENLDLGRIKTLISFAEDFLRLDLNKLNNNDLETIAFILQQESNVFHAIDDLGPSPEMQTKIDELMERGSVVI